MKKVGGRLIVLTLVVVLSVIFFIPSYQPFYQALPAWLKAVMPNKGITLGLDLQGGIHLVMEVDEDRAVEIAVDRSVVSLQDLLVDKKIPVESVTRTGPTQVTMQFQNAELKAQIQKLIEDYPAFLETESAGSANMLVWELRELEMKRIKDSAINQALETIRNRIDQFGVAEPMVQRQGLKQIVVQLPGVKEPKRAKDLIKETALLEFKLLDEDNQVKLDLPARIPKEKEAEVLRQAEAKLPVGDQILFERAVDKDTGREYRIPYLVKKRVMLTGDVLSDARVSIGQFNDPYVSITFDAKGGREFDRITGDNVRKRMAVVLDNTIYSAPMIQERITGGRAQITGTFSMQEASDLAIVLRAGALPAPLKIIQDLTVGPSLGKDSIDKGVQATLFAGALVVLFMMVYYRTSGVIADFALALNLLCLMGALSALNATLTLPGIAGIVLTIGMGVDSNVLIFERIREELRGGKAVRLAVDGGYAKALLTIVDSHVTTLITGVALFLFGTGPIKGFAVTLCLGIGINLFTALVGTKVIFDLMNQRHKVEQLSI
ncbi:MAG: protein translocase subunit SecD [Nitrospiraceae bacterium]|jgi:preprotein translocase subunit SecD|nr:protein translocase subunit SecD [Nitrospira sp.]MDW7649503.1 protein translocase subunit SecD [Nitrospiraceae bacterium]GDX89358.1 protein translocase subunit SecD [Nitrospirota bacterium]MBP0121020.1 protein translocase subunit SecD [Nitrospira sp.]MBP0124970.1 protein translocase subunit SecD [Nitrospira sp.]